MEQIIEAAAQILADVNDAIGYTLPEDIEFWIPADGAHPWFLTAYSPKQHRVWALEILGHAFKEMRLLGVTSRRDE